jgi:hypothetical protein
VARFDSGSVTTVVGTAAHETDAPSRESVVGKGTMSHALPARVDDDDRVYVQSRRQLDPFHRETCVRLLWHLARVQMATVPFGGWLGSSADEGRAKLR